jgi:hypothetical protein
VTCDRWFSPDTPVSSTNKTDYHDINEIMLKAGLKHNNPTLLFSNIKPHKPDE